MFFKVFQSWRGLALLTLNFTEFLRSRSAVSDTRMAKIDWTIADNFIGIEVGDEWYQKCHPTTRCQENV